MSAKCLEAVLGVGKCPAPPDSNKFQMPHPDRYKLKDLHGEKMKDSLYEQLSQGTAQ